MPTLF